MSKKVLMEKPEPEKDSKGFRIITEKYCSKLCVYNGGYEYPHLNANLYLHFQGFHKIQNLDNFTNLKVLYLENNCIDKIENLQNLKNLTCLYLQNNYIKEIENLENNYNLVILNLSNNKIKEIKNLEKLDKLENLYIEKNYISSIENLQGILDIKKLILLDIQNNGISENPEALLSLLERLEKLKVLYLKGNEIIRLINNYRRTLIVRLKHLTYLDDRPVREEDRIGAIAYLEGGYPAEMKAREKYRNDNERSSNKNKIKNVKSKESRESAEERRKKELEKLRNEYEMKRNQLEQRKKELIKEYESKPENRDELNQELANIDKQIIENEENSNEELKENKKENESNISLTQKIRGNDGEIFVYEKWMDDILELHVLENCFDFSRALLSIHTDFKNRKVKNYGLFKENDLRNKWTEFELTKFRKDSDNNTYHYTKEDFFPEEKKVEIKKESTNVNKEDEKENKRLNNNDKEDNEGEKKEGGFKVTILEGNIGEEIIDTSSKLLKQNEEGGLEDLD
jgi:dynein assembly factor 1